jgi:hypothetical protein
MAAMVMTASISDRIGANAALEHLFAISAVLMVGIARDVSQEY